MFWVAKLTAENYPTINDMAFKATLAEALDAGTQMALETPC